MPFPLEGEAALRLVSFLAVPAPAALWGALAARRVHHWIACKETNSDFGFALPWRGRLFGTYRAQPAAGHERMTIGVDAFRAREDLRLDRLLVKPFRDTPGGYAIDRRAERGAEEPRHA